MIKFYILVVAFMAVSLSAKPPIDVEFPSGKDRNIYANDFFKQPKIGKRYNELWFYAFVFDSGEKAYISYSIMNPPLIEGKCGADISIYNFDGKNYSVARGLPQSDLREIRSSGTIRIGRSFYMKGLPGPKHHVYYETDKNEGYLLELVFTSAIPGKVRGDGIFRLGDTQYGQYILIPYGKVTGTLRVGNVTKQLSGYGYMEHTWQNRMVSGLASHAIQVFGKGTMPVGRTIVGSKDYSAKPFGYSLDISSGTASVVFPRIVRGDHGTLTHKSPVSGRYEIKWISSSVLPCKFDRNDQQKYSALSTIDGFIKKKAARLGMGGEIMFHRGKIETRDGRMDYNVMSIE